MAEERIVEFSKFLSRYWKGQNVTMDFGDFFKQIEGIANDALVKINIAKFKIIEKVTKQSIKALTDRIYNEYSKRIGQSGNPITKQVLKALKAVCDTMNGSPERYFSIRTIDKTTTEISVVPFDIELFNTETRPQKQLYYRAAGETAKGLKIARVFAKKQHSSTSDNIGLGILIEFGRTSSGVINNMGDTTIRPRFTNTFLKGDYTHKKGKNQLQTTGFKRKVLIFIDKRTGKYIFRAQSRYGSLKGKEVLYTKKNVMRAGFRKYFEDTFWNLLNAEWSKVMDKYVK